MKTTILTDQLMLNRIQAMHDAKMLINKEKIAHFEKYNTDDHGFIYDPDFHLDVKLEEGEISLHSAMSIAKAIRKYLETMPAYINNQSALAGAWYGALNSMIPTGLNRNDVPEKLQACWEEYHTFPGFDGMNHCAPDMTIGFELGWGGLRRKIEYYREFNAPTDPSFYNAELEVIIGIQNWVARLAKKAHEMAAAEADPIIKQNLLEIAEINEWLVENPPRNLREVCQFIVHFQSVDRIYFLGGALGQIDELLRPYFVKDKAEGKITDDEAVWYIASVLFNDTHYAQIGGLTPDGSHDTASYVSYLILEAIHLLGIPTNISFRVHDKADQELFRRALEYTLEDGSGLCYSMDEGTVQGFVRHGYSETLGRMRKKVGCNWTAIPGEEYSLQDVTRCNMVSAFTHAMDDMRGQEDITLEKLFEAFAHHVEVIVESIKEGYDIHYEKKHFCSPELVLNLFMRGPIERGMDASHGGVDIMDLNIDGMGIVTVADSFAAIEQRIINEKRLTWDELYAVLDANWEDAEPVRLMMKNIARYGAPGSLSDKWAKRSRDVFVNACVRTNTPKHNIRITPGLFSHGEIYKHGSWIKATPNGRFDGDEICHSAEPDPGFAKGYNTFSPSLKATAVANLQAGRGNSAPLQLDIDTSMLEAEGGIDALMALINAHNHMGGTLINLNCLSKEVLLEAHEDPSTHPDLVVRVTGYSAFFASLSKEYRQQVVDRFLSGS